MKNLDETTHKQLMFLASKLPTVLVNGHENHLMTKEELIEMGFVISEKDGTFNEAKMLEDGKYIYKAPVQVAKNHYRCMKRAFFRNGSEGVGKYIDRINALPNA